MYGATRSGRNHLQRLPQASPDGFVLLPGDGTNDAEIAALSWERYKLRNDSVVLDLFSGQYRY
eukprot:2383661-Rhodomonas_salina.1